MLSELTLEYEDGTRVVKVVPKSESTIYPQRDNIKHCTHRSFKYEVSKHPYLCVAIVKMGEEYRIMPEGINCIPETELSDVLVIDNLPKIVEKPKQENKWMFESSSGDGFYQVRENMGKLKCSCPGSWRAFDKRCKHIKEVEKELGIVK